MDTNSLHNLARTGDQAAEEELFRRLGARFRLFVEHRVGCRQDAEEMVQDTLLVILKKYKKTDITTSFAAWAYRVLEFEILRYYKKKGLRERKFGELQRSESGREGRSSDPTLKRRLLDCLVRIGRQNRKYARILNLHYQGYTTGEVCRRLDLTENYSYVLLSRARSMLAECLDRGDIK
ncbi:MAG TPA: sigma-70 family RNA polymerase sigma factor [Acidobacteriota bacterium]|nr:sigma-70 family RNA polymerase sigma factor [Acidobacteriota bacterium]